MKRGFFISLNTEQVHEQGAQVSATLFPLLQTRPLLGRTFSPDEEKAGGARVALLGYGLWRRSFGGDQNVIGRSVIINEQPHTIVGVMPPDFKFHWLMMPRTEREIWIPRGPPSESQDRGSHNFSVVARLKRGVTIEQAQANMDAIARGVAELNPGGRIPPDLEARSLQMLAREVMPAFK